MAIGPESRYSASGRIVVVAALQGAIGATAAIIGLGPWLEGAGAAERIMGAAGTVLGAVMVVGSLALGLRRKWARLLGALGGWAMVTLGAIIAALTTTGLGVCDTGGRATMPCYAVLGAIGLAGIAMMGVGAASIAIVSRAPAMALRRRRR